MADQLSQEAYQEFYAECDEVMGRVSQCLTAIEQNKHNAGTIDSLYRDIHTLKGSSQLFGFMEIGKVAHAMETALEPVRRRNAAMNSYFVDSLLSCLDLVDKMTKAQKAETSNLGIDPEVLNLTVSRLLEAASRNFGTDILITKDIWNQFETAQKFKVEHNATENGSETDQKGKEKQMDQPEKNLKRTIESSPINTQIESKEEINTAHQDSNTTIRVQVALLDRLMILVGEMVLVRNQVLQFSQTHEDFTFLNLSQKLDLVTTELQDEVMKTRMQPIGSILSKFSRVVRDLSRELNKQMEITIEGAETELDKTLIEAIKDPLTHIIRNACDHGIESPEDRKRSGKNPIGKLNVSSQQESGQVVVEVSDDGRGLDAKKLIEKAIEKKLISPERAQTLSEREIFQIIFMPGFSTAQQVSSVSGRGVGMDVVKTNIEKIGGAVDLKSELGKGTTIRLRIPLTLAIVPALIVRFKKDRFSIPQVKLVELVRVDGGESSQKLEFLQGRPVFRLRGNLLPLVTLEEVIEEKPAQSSQENLKNRIENGINIVVLSTDSGPFGLIVDEILDTADIVVKPLAKFLKKLMVYSGSTIMGDGSVSLIFDVMGIAQKANLIQHHKRNHDHKVDEDVVRLKTRSDAQEMLSFALNAKGNFTLPLCLVQRLEEFSRDEIEFSGKQRIVQYRNAVLPLISLNEMLNLSPAQNELSIKDELKVQNHNSTKIPVIVIQRRNRLYGIEVNEIIDIFLAEREIEAPIKETPGILGNIIIGTEVATVVDVLEIIDLATGFSNVKDIIAQRNLQNPTATRNKKNLNILFAEDTIFFVKQVLKILNSQGYNVTHASDGEEAFNILERSAPGDFDLVLSDIEMPRLNGFQLAKKIRESKQHSKIPLIAMTTRFKDSDIVLGKEAGFDRYLEKLKGQQLLDTIEEILTLQNAS